MQFSERWPEAGPQALKPRAGKLWKEKPSKNKETSKQRHHDLADKIICWLRTDNPPAVAQMKPEGKQSTDITGIHRFLLSNSANRQRQENTQGPLHSTRPRRTRLHAVARSKPRQFPKLTPCAGRCLVRDTNQRREPSPHSPAHSSVSSRQICQFPRRNLPIKPGTRLAKIRDLPRLDRSKAMDTL